MKNAKIKLSWIFIPLYIGIFIVLIRWSFKLSSPDFKLSEEDMKAFSGKAEIKNDDYKFYEPNLEDLSYTISYRNVNETKIEEDKKFVIPKKEQSDKKEDNDEKVKKEDLKLNNEKEIPKVADIKQKEMISVGYKKGFLSQAVGRLINNPKAIKALFDNEYVVKGFLERETVKKALSDPKFLENFLSNQQVISNFLKNENVKAALSNPQVINAIAQSKLMNEIINSQAVNQLLTNDNAINNLMQKNPQISELLANPNVLQALSQNPQGSKLLMNIKK